MSDEINTSPDFRIFSWLDSIVFIGMSILCILVGIYFGFRKKAHSELNYLVGGRKMKTLPIALSIISSFVSGIGILGIPTEAYLHGTQYSYTVISIVFKGIIVSVFFLPVLHNLKITTTHEYLERRFDRRLRMFGSVLFAIMCLLKLPIVLYIPALALNQVTGISVHLLEPIICIICVFYTTLGGLKAVVWSDVVQTITMLGSCVLVAVKGTYDIGGVGKVIHSAWSSERLEAPILNFDPTIRHTFWTQVIGGTFFWTQTIGLSQDMMQRYFALPTLTAARRALWIFCAGVIVFILICGYTGLLIYATYEHCDPLTTKLAKAPDQLLPLYVMETLGEIPGLTGIFIAGIFSATLSTLSTSFNSMSAVVLEDFVKPLVKTELSKSIVKWIMMVTVVVMGVLCVLLAYAVEHMGTILQLSMTLKSVANGPFLALFIIGVFMPWLNGNSALTGGILSGICMMWLVVKAQLAIMSKTVSMKSKELSVDQCSYQFESQMEMSLANITDAVGTENIETGFQLHRISYMWYACLGTLLTILIAAISSCFFGRNDLKLVDSSLLAPCIRSRCRNSKDYKPVQSVELDVPRYPENYSK